MCVYLISKASAPGKIILFGEHFVVHGVKAILATINKRITVTSEKISKPNIIIIKSQLGNIEIDIISKKEKTSKELLPFEFLAKKMINEFSYKGGISIEIKSDIPHGVGLGSSSAACVAAAASISGLFTIYSKEKICDLAIEAEKTIFVNTSGADCTACTFGGIIEYEKESGFKKIKSEPNLNLIISNSEIIHSTDKIVSKVILFKENNQEKFEKLCEKESKLINSVRIQLQKEDAKNLGKLMKENQGYLEDIGVSNDTLNNILEITNKASFGSKITGAGGGGCIISITDENTINDTIKKLDKELQIQSFPVKIDYNGLETF